MDIRVLIEQIENNLTLPYFFAQLITIIALFIYGYFFMVILSDKSKEDRILKVLLAYPMGLSVYSVVGYLMLTFGIYYSVFTVEIACFLAAAVTYVILRRKCGKEVVTDRVKVGFGVVGTRFGAAVLVIVILAAALSCSGLLSVTVSNDSMYNYSFYPRAIVYFGGLRVNFDTFLTDVGQGCAIINTLPFLFGFNETFGIQHMLNLSFIGLFYLAVFESFKGIEDKIGIKMCHVLSGVCTALLMCSLPVVLISKWILANDYFAVLMFICVYLAVKISDKRNISVAALSIFIAALSIVRIEGGVFAALFILCISTYKYSNRELGLAMLCPVIILHASYSARIFLTMDITAPYKFLTPMKALMMVGIMAAVLVYLLFIRGRLFNKFFGHLRLIIAVGLIGLNGLLFINNPSVYMGNLSTFIGNVMYKGGWGVIVAVVLSVYLICLTNGFEFGYWDFMTFTYLFYSIAVSFMRENGLQLGAGDSGNRVLLQVVPMLLFAAVSHIPKVLKESRGTGLGS